MRYIIYSVLVGIYKIKVKVVLGVVKITIEINEEELALFEKVAEKHGVDVPTIIRNIAVEAIAVETYLQLMEDYEDRKAKGEVEYMSFEEMKEALK